MRTQRYQQTHEHTNTRTHERTIARTAIPDGAAAASSKGAEAGGEDAPPAQTRAELETEIKAATEEMNAAMKAKAFDKCSEIQAKLDTLEAARAKLPTAAELDKKVRVRESDSARDAFCPMLKKFTI